MEGQIPGLTQRVTRRLEPRCGRLLAERRREVERETERERERGRREREVEREWREIGRAHV